MPDHVTTQTWTPTSTTMSDISRTQPVSRLALCMLNAMFGKADVLNHPEEQIHVLLDVDGDGDLDEDDDEYFTFIKYDGSQYEPGHGRYKCDTNCSRKRKPPHNCGYHPDYLFPVNFSPCSRKCKGAFCKCIRGGTFDI